MSSFTNVPSESAQKPQQGVQRHSLNQILEHSSHSVCSAAPSLAPYAFKDRYVCWFSQWRSTAASWSIVFFHPPSSESFQSLVARSQVEVELDKCDESEEEKSCNNGVSVDYSSWKADEVRKECTRRGLKVKGNLKKDERIMILMHHNMLQASIGSSTISSVSVVSDEFATRFSQSGDKPPRAALDTREVNDRSCFWADVQAAFATTYAEDHPVNLLHIEDDFFKDIDLSVTKVHSAKKLFEMWKDVNKHYIVAEKRFTTSGQHENEFKNFV
ncbi:hypothetical protein GN958_ATG01378 [Phytophthora infestans]|uniref:Uncharacterized protein n=1 Tax=Phytophthora infestans TaxID=4787 RepID=A0A8S9V7F7_PHYIN|nr:hypothetical protein GN958_ATG01378 [Phytophthora infestans]